MGFEKQILVLQSTQPKLSTRKRGRESEGGACNIENITHRLQIDLYKYECKRRLLNMTNGMTGVVDLNFINLT